MSSVDYLYYRNELYHHGIKGQKWGIRRYQNPDGTWTEEGLRRRRYGFTGHIARTLKDRMLHPIKTGIEESNRRLSSDRSRLSSYARSYGHNISSAIAIGTITGVAAMGAMRLGGPSAMAAVAKIGQIGAFSVSASYLVERGRIVFADRPNKK